MVFIEEDNNNSTKIKASSFNRKRSWNSYLEQVLGPKHKSVQLSLQPMVWTFCVHPESMKNNLMRVRWIGSECDMEITIRNKYT